jgi:hypothetical protein
MNLKKSIAAFSLLVSFSSLAQTRGDFNQNFDNIIAKKIISTRIESTNSRKFEIWEGLHTQNSCRTAPAFKGDLCGVKNMRHALEELIVSFPDYKLELIQVFRSKKDMFAKIRSTGTFLNPLDIGGGVVIPPTGKSFSQEWVANIRLNHAGKIERFEEFYDQQDLMIQLGLGQ